MTIDDSINTVFGSFLVIGGVVCMWCCVYRYAQIQENRVRSNTLSNGLLIPRVYTSDTVSSHQSGLIVIPP